MRPDVLVVGAGPVGLTLAVDLARRGVAVRIIDQLEAPTTQSRAVVVHARSLEMMDALGVADRVIASGYTTTSTEFHSGGETLVHVPLDTVDSPFPFSITTPQTETERILTARLAELGVSVERGSTFAGLEQDDSGVRVTVRDVSGAEEVFECGWLVGADGARSGVRHALGMKLEGSFKGERFLMGDVDAEHPYDKSAIHIFFSPGDTAGMIFTMSPRRLRLMVQIPDGTDVERPASEEWLASAVAERGMDVQIVASHWLTIFEIHHAQVPRYRVGRVFLAGDAAHVHSPAGGQGMNTGMQDAFNLSWKLALAASGAPHEDLLDSYHDERHPVAAMVIRGSTAMTKAATIRSPLLRDARNRMLKQAFSHEAVRRRVADAVEEMTVGYHDSPLVLPGGRGPVKAGDAVRSVPGTGLWRAALPDGAVPGAPHTVLLIEGADGEPVDFPTVPARVLRVGTDGDIADPERRIADQFGLREGGAVLVRPDGYVGAIAAREAFRDRQRIVDYLEAAGSTSTD